MPCLQVYTFMLTPMLSPKAAGEDVASSSSSSSLSAGSSAGPATTVVGEPGVGSTVADIAAAARAAARGAAVTGWALKLVMEYCDEVGDMESIVLHCCCCTRNG
jgi:hypothetical protein